MQIADVDCASCSPVEYQGDRTKIAGVHATLDELRDRQPQRLHHDLRGPKGGGSGYSSRWSELAGIAAVREPLETSRVKS